ncbi:SH3-like domain-containing protein [Pseudorhizobium tarimense]|uniref:SH3-like domain-containing protein n=1 Tax=Pseudorhizobium tarimense TaxID=1079109 RepID=A0ABV2H5W7_9HYPH|nr:SH3 domain-containing protein [Pseudorhizobium tarimense]MCJ8519225.1 SH3 domain-containing protein [Pseudorhizobium tarimense]
MPTLPQRASKPFFLLFHIALSALAPAAFPTSGTADAQVVSGEEHCVVNIRADDVLNVRRQPSAKASIASRLRHNDCGVIVTGACHGDWCPVEARHDTGWVHSRYISMVSPSLYCVTGVSSNDRLNLRRWPSPQSQVVTTLPPNQCDIAFLPYATDGWQKVRVEGWEGWVDRRFVSGQ